MNGKEMIRQALIDNDIYPMGEINACIIYKNWEGWHIQKFGEVVWKAGATVEEALEAIKEMRRLQNAELWEQHAGHTQPDWLCELCNCNRNLMK